MDFILRSTHLALLSFLATTLVPFAQTQTYDEVFAQRFLDQYDFDGDSLFEDAEPVPTAWEATYAAVWEQYSYLDTNGDSALSLAELELLPRIYLETGYESVLDVFYKQTDQESLYLDLYYPDTATYQGNLPVVFLSHGGGWVAGSKQDGNASDTGKAALSFIEEGFCVVIMNYRLAKPSLGKYTEECIQDCRDSMRYIASNAEALGIDPNRFFTMGYSAGGHLSAMNLLPSAELFAGDEALEAYTFHTTAGIEWYGWMNLVDEDSDLFFQEVGRTSSSVQSLVVKPEYEAEPSRTDYLRRLSPYHYLNSGSAPLLVIHGDMDTAVSVEQARFIESYAAEVSAPVSVQIVQDATHGWSHATSPTQAEVLAMTGEFLVSYRNQIRLTTTPDTSVSVTLSSALSSDGAYSVTTQPTNGELAGTLPDLTYTPDAEFVGEDTFVYQHTIDGVLTESFTVRVVVLEEAPAFFYTTPIITSVGALDSYATTEAETASFRSTSVAKSYDLDEDDVYGTAGYYFIGDGETAAITQSLPSFVASVATGEDIEINYPLYSGADYDDPTATIASEVVDWERTTLSGALDTTADNVGEWIEVLAITLSNAAPTQFRLGVMTGIISDARRGPSGIRLSMDGGGLEPVTYLSSFEGLGMVFFDITIPANAVTGATLILETQRKEVSSWAYITGVTFDEVTRSGYSTWVDDYGITADPLADDDGDGLTQLLDYVLGRNPLDAEGDLAPRIESADGLQQYRFSRSTLATTDTVQYVEYSTDLQEWTLINVADGNLTFLERTSLGDGMEEVVIDLGMLVPDTGEVYTRMGATQLVE